MNTNSELTTIAVGELNSTTKLPVEGQEHLIDVDMAVVTTVNRAAPQPVAGNPKRWPSSSGKLLLVLWC